MTSPDITQLERSRSDRLYPRPRLVLTLTLLWAGAYAISAAAMLLGTLLATGVVFDTILGALKTLSGLYIPVLSCFCGFWFGEARNARDQQVPREHAIAALALTALFLGAVFVGVIWIVYGVNYNSPAYKTITDHPAAPTLQQYTTNFVELMLLISFIATMPVMWLTGHRITSATQTRRRKTKKGST